MQISAGVALAVSTAGIFSTFGVFLIREGSSDIVFAVRTGVNGTFSWTEYILEKGIGLPFSLVSFGVERWLFGALELAGPIVWRSAVTASSAAVRGVVNVLLGKCLEKVKDWILESCQKKLEAKIESKFSQIFVNLQEDVEELFRLNPANAERLIWDAFEEVLKKADVRRDVVNNLVILIIEVVANFTLMCLSKKTEKEMLGILSAVIIKFVGLSALSATECLLARNLLTSLDEALKTLCQQNQAADRQLLAPPAEDEENVKEFVDGENVQEFLDRFKQRVKASVVQKVSERVRRDLRQAIMQSISEIMPWAWSKIHTIKTWAKSASSLFLCLWKWITGKV